MRKQHKPDFICKYCQYNRVTSHACLYTARYGDDYNTPFARRPKSGRIGLTKDGLGCKYFCLDKGKSHPDYFIGRVKNEN